MDRTTIVTQAEVVRTLRVQTVDEAGGSDLVDDAIQYAEDLISEDFGDPMERSRFSLNSNNTIYEIRNDNKKIFRINTVLIRKNDNDRRVYTGTTTASELGLTYVFDNEFNTITFASETISAWNGRIVEVTYVPSSYYNLVKTHAALYLLETSNIVNGQEEAPTQLISLRHRVKILSEAMTTCEAVGSANERYYDPTLGKYIKQRRFTKY